jgi:hypothetical protein
MEREEVAAADAVIRGATRMAAALRFCCAFFEGLSDKASF